MPARPRLVRLRTAGAIVAIVAIAVPALALAPAATASAATKKSAGDANSSATLLSMRVGGTSLQSVTASLEASDIAKPSSALIRLVPVTLNGTKYGEQKISNGSHS